MIKGIIFDMDGVLFDSEPFYLQRRHDFFNSQGISINHLAPKDFIGGNLQHIWKRLFDGTNTIQREYELSAAYAAYKSVNKLPYADLLFPEVLACLSMLKQKGLQLAVASNSSREDVEHALESCHLKSYFSVVLGREDVPNGKPAPDIYQAAARALGYANEELLVVEDSQKGIAAAKAAGLNVVAITDCRYDIDQSQADKQIDHLGQLAPILAQD